jgi:hypothetical protein
MAGYYLYSLNWRKFTALVERPSRNQLAVLAEALDVERDQWIDGCRKGDPVLDWPPDAEGLAPLVADRLPRKDWYGDLPDSAQGLWAHAVLAACMGDKLRLDFRAHGVVYWDTVEVVLKWLGVRPETPGKKALSRFGMVPFRYRLPKKTTRYSLNWSGHSMHPPAEVRRMRAELRSVGPAMEAAVDADLSPRYSNRELRQMPERARERTAPDIRREFSEVLLPAVEWVGAKGRLLFVGVDT